MSGGKLTLEMIEAAAKRCAEPTSSLSWCMCMKACRGLNILVSCLGPHKWAASNHLYF